MIIRRAPKPSRDIREWHTKFIIWPRRMNSGEIRALETVMRKGTFVDDSGPYMADRGGWVWQYEECVRYP